MTNKVDIWVRKQSYNSELKRAKERRGIGSHESSCQCAGCRDAKYYASQESE